MEYCGCGGIRGIKGKRLKGKGGAHLLFQTVDRACFGVAIGYGINQIPGLSSGTKMSLVVVTVLAILAAVKVSAK